MRWSYLILAVLASIALTLILSAIFHTFVVVGFAPLLFVPFAFRSRR